MLMSCTLTLWRRAIAITMSKPTFVDPYTTTSNAFNNIIVGYL